MNPESKNNCENCAHFARHYIKSSAIQIMPVNCGHCLDHLLSAQEKRSFPFIKNCPSWQSKEIDDTKQLQSIQKSMQTISHRLDEIALALKDKIDEI